MAATPERPAAASDRDLSGPLMTAALAGPVACIALTLAGRTMGLGGTSLGAELLRLLPIVLVSLHVAALANEARQARARRVVRVQRLRERARRRRRAWRAARRREAELERVRQLRSAFLACLTHEVRTPMDGILGMNELALATELSAEQAELLSAARDSTHALLAVIDGVLDYERLAGGAVQLEAVPFDLEDVLAAAVRRLSRRGLRAARVPVCHIAPGLPSERLGDPQRLEQVLVALGARAALHARGSAIVIDLSAGERDDVLCLSITDGGLRPDGALPLQRLQPFEEDDELPGLGMELGVASAVASLMDGELLERRDPSGSRELIGSLRCPLRQPERPPRVQPAQPRQVLVVDGDLVRREALCTTLTELGAQVRQADTAREALDLLEQSAGQSPLVLVDFALADRERLQQGWDRHFAEHGGQCLRVLEPDQLAADDDAVARPLLPGILSRLLWPHDLDAAPVAIDAAPGSPAQRRLRLLLAEDTAVSREVARRMLVSWGHTVFLAEDGQAALEISAEQQIDAVLMDVSMPIMDGLAATAALRAREHAGGPHLPIIAMTAHAGPDDRRRCLAAGMDDFVTKPVRAAELFAVLERLPLLQACERDSTWSTSNMS